MTTGSRIMPAAPKPDSALMAQLRTLPVANVSDNMLRLYGGYDRLRPMHDGSALCGPALTVRTRPGDNLFVHKAIDIAEPGDVIVVDAGGDTTNSIIGEIMLRLALARGIAGFVIDGAIRDAGAIAAGSLPVFALGAAHRGPYKDGPGEINVPISIGGMPVSPGDIMLGDADGVLAVPQADAPGVLSRALAQNDQETEIFRSIDEGTIDRSWVDATLKSRGYVR